MSPSDPKTTANRKRSLAKTFQRIWHGPGNSPLISTQSGLMFRLAITQA